MQSGYTATLPFNDNTNASYIQAIEDYLDTAMPLDRNIKFVSLNEVKFQIKQ